jgi:hypothetical protein
LKPVINSTPNNLTYYQSFIMKKTFFAIVCLLGVFLMGCQKDSLSPLESSDFEGVVLSAARFSAEADPTTKVICRGKLTELATADIPANIKEYIAAKYAGAEVKFAGKDEAGNVLVGLKLADGTHRGLLFDKTGALKAELKHYGKRAKLTRVDVAALPGAVTSYIATNHAGAAIKHAGTNESGELFVMIVKDGTPAVLVFDATGTFIKVAEKPMKGKKHGPGHK